MSLTSLACSSVLIAAWISGISGMQVLRRLQPSSYRAMAAESTPFWAVRVIPCLSVGPLMPNFSRHVLFNTKMYQLLKNLSKLNSSQFNNASVRCVFSNLSKGYAQWLFGDVLNERWSTERAALIKRLARAWEQEA